MNIMDQNIKAHKNIGENIQKGRKEKGLTQEQLSAQLQVIGCDISRGTLAKIEAGIRHISLEELNAIKEVLEMTYDEILRL